MKISLWWILDHIADQIEISAEFAARLVETFNLKTAEIEHTHPLFINPEKFVALEVQAVTEQHVIGFCHELNITCMLPPRPYAVGVNDWYLVAPDSSGKPDSMRWITLADLGGDKDGLVPAVGDDDWALKSGEWRDQIAWQDYIFEIDNKSINHRPDLWGHQGCGREVAALMNLTYNDLKYEKMLPAHKALVTKKSAASRSYREAVINDLTVRLDQNCAGKRLVVCDLGTVQPKPCLTRIATRLARVGMRPKDALIDLTNYSMIDVGQPMHGFDHDMLKGELLELRAAQAGEHLVLLDGERIDCTASDSVIADSIAPLSLAGIMGGIRSGLSPQTRRVVVEAAAYDAATIRRSATRHKHRTEASMRFEKSIDPLAPERALGCFLMHAEKHGILPKQPSLVAVIETAEFPQQRDIFVTATHIHTALGVQLPPEIITALLTSLGFGVHASDDGYRVTVPSYRPAKDISIPQDIVEEIGRMYGYQKITPQLPLRPMQAHGHESLQIMRRLQQTCAEALSLHELCSYAFFDEQFLAQLACEPARALTIANPVSENWKHPVTSLIPHLLKACKQNAPNHDILRFFEMQKIWEQIGSTDAIERHVCACCLAVAHGTVDFYAGKAAIEQLAATVPVPIEWKKVDTSTTELPHWIAEPIQSWMSPVQTAIVWCAGKPIGYAGLIQADLSKNLWGGSAFVAELDLDELIAQRTQPLFEPLGKYQTVQLDISMLAPYRITVTEVEKAIQSADARIRRTWLIDYFEKPDWRERRSVTIRFLLRDDYKTFEKHDIEQVLERAQAAVKALGVEVRT